ncbi:MAG: hypothetical protein KKH33_07045 [Alphaproteobacteria bacterium]|nr:hypothetical protein [Alphaproteobacteria bacterium]
MFPKKKFPLQQGDLDYLCAVYCVLNCLNALGELQCVAAAGAQFSKLFRSIAKDKMGDPIGAITQGFDPVSAGISDINWLGKIAAGREMLDDVRDVETAQDLDAMLASSPMGGIIYFYSAADAELTHYTFVKKVGPPGCYPLWDSFGFQHLNIRADQIEIDGNHVFVTHFWKARP